ncbi:MAG: sigma-54-dependent Fis family transcriptional regulator [Proteobacteria bacterium]|nr:sigma-54-dependent Fis family transcriptional regulator [Pseudomonadota bacterium]
MNDIKGNILIIDDDQELRALVTEFFSGHGFRVHGYALAKEALEALSEGGALSNTGPAGDIDVILSDIRMPEMDGITFAEALKNLRPEIPVILMTAYGSVETAIEAMQKGAYHYVIKPFKMAELEATVQKALEFRSLQKDNTALRIEVKKNWSFGNVIGKSDSMKRIYDLVARIAGANSNVLITGESGTGKEMIAKAIHESGPRAQKPFVAINCTAIPENLLESELFGHAKGSFTGAIQRKKGLFEEANGGTIFLDEIGDMNVLLQSKLLRVIQERKIRAVGENTPIDVNVRVIAATHKDLRLAMKEGRFRDDLYYRLSVIPVQIPPLRHRKEDIPLLAEHFLKKYTALNHMKVRGFTKRAIAKLMGMKWEGNVRELENVVERAVVLCSQTLVDEGDIPTPEAQSADEFFGEATSDYPSLTKLEERYIRLIMEKTGGRKDKASQILGINRRTLYRKEREYGMVPAGTGADSASEPGLEEDFTENTIDA